MTEDKPASIVKEQVMTIKPCPYCASKAGAVLTRAAGLYWHHVECSNEECRATGPERGGEAEAIAAWNTRTLPLDGDVVERNPPNGNTTGKDVAGMVDIDGTIATLDALSDRQRHERGDKFFTGIADPELTLAKVTLRNARDLVERVTEALTPSAETEAAYIGEFQIDSLIGYDKHGNELHHSVDVPWTTIKEIMAAIRERAALSSRTAE